MTTQLECHLLRGLEAVSAGIARLEAAFAAHLTAHAEYDASKRFNAEVRRGRFRWVITTLLAAPTVVAIFWRFW